MVAILKKRNPHDFVQRIEHLLLGNRLVFKLVLNIIEEMVADVVEEGSYYREGYDVLIELFHKSEDFVFVGL